MIREDKDLPSVYAKYSDHYVSGQKVTKNTVEYLYLRELHDCMKMNLYMGLWQLAQVASALQILIVSVYPMEADPIMRLNFNRTFFPMQESPLQHNDTTPIIVMWTSIQPGMPPVHFVPLLPKCFKYEN